VQRGWVEIAVSHWLAACNRIGAVVCSLPWACQQQLTAHEIAVFSKTCEIMAMRVFVGAPTVKVSVTHHPGGSARRVIGRADETFRVRFHAAAQAPLEARPWPQTFGAEKGQRTRPESRQRAWRRSRAVRSRRCSSLPARARGLARRAHEAQLVLITSALCCGSRASFGPDLASTSAEPAPGDPA
jgi:hypothetical protein